MTCLATGAMAQDPSAPDTPPGGILRQQLMRILEAFVCKFGALRAVIPIYLASAKAPGEPAKEGSVDSAAVATAPAPAQPTTSDDGPLTDSPDLDLATVLPIRTSVAPEVTSDSIKGAVLAGCAH